MNPASIQSSQLLPALFRGVEDDQRLAVLHLGPARQDTLDFFSQRRCRLHIVDVFAELPLPAEEDTEHGLSANLRDLLQLSGDTVFDVCLFWDLFNYLDARALRALLEALEPCLGKTTVAHGFSVHNPRSPDQGLVYGINDTDAISMRRRGRSIPGYRPHSQNRLLELLYCFRMERTVLLADQRLEMLLRARTGSEQRAPAGHTGRDDLIAAQIRKASA
ncbi:MAG: hypothetical protein KDI09_17635 [Halioglobus sp.]|nr:hypothetical protein [Halioglobus sp.]